MTTIKSIDLPGSITLRGIEYRITNWETNGSLSGWVGHVTGLPDHDNADDLEYEVWVENRLHCDVYEDGTGQAHISV